MPYRDPAKAKEANRVYREQNRERLLAYQKNYRERNREKLREWHRNDRKNNTRRRRLGPYNLTQAQLDTMLVMQLGLCAICQLPPDGKGPNAVLHIDHDHATGKVRGLLCQACNRGLGFFRDDPDRHAHLRAAG